MDCGTNPDIFSLFGIDLFGDIQNWFCELLNQILGWIQEALGGIEL